MKRTYHSARAAVNRSAAAWALSQFGGRIWAMATAVR
jgi:hypothetical protein